MRVQTIFSKGNVLCILYINLHTFLRCIFKIVLLQYIFYSRDNRITAFDLDTTLGFQKERQYFKRTSPFVTKLLFKEDRIVQRLIHGVVRGLVISPVL